MSQEPSNGPIPTPTPQQNADGGQPAHFEALDAALVSFISSQNGRLLPSFEQHLHEIERALEKTPMASHFPSMTATLKNMRESAERSKEAALLFWLLLLNLPPDQETLLLLLPLLHSLKCFHPLVLRGVRTIIRKNQKALLLPMEEHPEDRAIFFNPQPPCKKLHLQQMNLWLKHIQN